MPLISKLVSVCPSSERVIGKSQCILKSLVNSKEPENNKWQPFQVNRDVSYIIMF